MWLYWLVWRQMMAKHHKKIGEAHDQEIPGKQQWNFMLLLRQQYWKRALRHTSDNKALRKCKLKMKTVSRDNSKFTAWEKPKGLSRKVQQTILRNSRGCDVPTPVSVCPLTADDSTSGLVNSHVLYPLQGHVWNAAEFFLKWK